MNMTLPPSLHQAIKPLFEALPPDAAMTALVVERPLSDQLSEIVANMLQSGAVDRGSPLEAGLWLYVDELDKSHRVSQSIDDATGSFWHGIMHRREGDFANSHYWFRRVGAHELIPHIDDYDPHDLIDQVEAAHGRGEQPGALIEMQRREWMMLFNWCADHYAQP